MTFAVRGPGTALRARSFTLRPRPPFAFDLVLDYLLTSPSTIVERVTEHEYLRAIRLDGRPAAIGVRSTGTVDAPALEVTVWTEGAGDEREEDARAWAARCFGVEADLAPLASVGERDPVFGALIEAYRGLRPVLIPDLFEALVWAILGQQVNVAFAARTKRAVVEAFGERVELNGTDLLLFPTPERIAGQEEAALAALQLSRQKVRYILHLAQEIASGRLDLEGLRGLPAEDAQARLEGLLGVGRWTAEYLLLRGLGHPDAIPAADGGLRRIIGRAYGLGRSASEAEVREIAQAWTGWRGYAAFYWWYTLQREARARREGDQGPGIRGNAQPRRCAIPHHTGRRG